VEDVGDRAKWRFRTKVADTLINGIKAREMIMNLNF